MLKTNASGFACVTKRKDPLAEPSPSFCSLSDLKPNPCFSLQIVWQSKPHKTTSGLSWFFCFLFENRKKKQREVRWVWWVSKKTVMGKWGCLLFHWGVRINTGGWTLSSLRIVMMLHSTIIKRTGVRVSGNLFLPPPSLLLSTLFFLAMVCFSLPSCLTFIVVVVVVTFMKQVSMIYYLVKDSSFH
jgi:hypothetical protein